MLMFANCWFYMLMFTSGNICDMLRHITTLKGVYLGIHSVMTDKGRWIRGINVLVY